MLRMDGDGERKVREWEMDGGRGQVDYRNFDAAPRPRPSPGLSEHRFSCFAVDFSYIMCIMIFIVEAETTFKEPETWKPEL